VGWRKDALFGLEAISSYPLQVGSFSERGEHLHPKGVVHVEKSALQLLRRKALVQLQGGRRITLSCQVAENWARNLGPQPPGEFELNRKCSVDSAIA